MGELQKCLDDTITQWWSFDLDKGRLHNAADEIYIADMQGEAAAGSAAGTPAVDNGFRSLSAVTAVRTRLPRNSCTQTLSRADSSGATLWQTWCSLSREESSSRGQRLFSAPVEPILMSPLRLNSALITDKANGS